MTVRLRMASNTMDIALSWTVHNSQPRTCLALCHSRNDNGSCGVCVSSMWSRRLFPVTESAINSAAQRSVPRIAG